MSPLTVDDALVALFNVSESYSSQASADLWRDIPQSLQGWTAGEVKRFVDAYGFQYLALLFEREANKSSDVIMAAVPFFGTCLQREECVKELGESKLAQLFVRAATTSFPEVENIEHAVSNANQAGALGALSLIENESLRNMCIALREEFSISDDNLSMNVDLLDGALYDTIIQDGNPIGDAVRPPPLSLYERDYSSGDDSSLEETSDFEGERNTLDIARRDEFPYMERSLLFFDKNNNIRQQFIDIVDGPQFDTVILIFILTNTFFIAIQDPRYEPTGSVAKYLFALDMMFNVVFTIEMIMKMIAYGLILHKRAYLRSGWNVIDFIIIMGGWLGYLYLNDSAISSLRAVRVLRPLRSLQRVRSLRMIIESIISSIPSLLDLSVLSFLVFLVFGITGVQLLNGLFLNRCFPEGESEVPVDPDTVCTLGTAERDLWLLFYDNVQRVEDMLRIPDPLKPWYAQRQQDYFGYVCESDQVCGSFENPNYGVTSFDNFYWASLVVFQVLTLEGWTDIMYWAQDATYFNIWVYFVGIVLIGSFFVVNMATAVLTDSYFKSNDEMDEEEQEEEEVAKKEVASHPPGAGMKEFPEVPTKKTWKQTLVNKLTARWDWMYDHFAPLTSHWAFNAVIAAVVIINTIALCLIFYGMPPWLFVVIIVLNRIILCIFVGELVVLVLGAGGFWCFCQSFLNCYIAFVTIISVGEALIQDGLFMAKYFYGYGLPEVWGYSITIEHGLFMSTLRTLWLLPYISSTSWAPEDFRMILRAFDQGFQAVQKLALLILFFIFIYAITGMGIFGLTFDFPEGTPRENFDSLANSMLTVFQIITGENWNNVWYSGMRSSARVFAVPYFFSLFIIGQYVLLNLFVSIIVEVFSSRSNTLMQREQELSQAIAASPAIPGATVERNDAEKARLISRGGEPIVGEGNMARWKYYIPWIARPKGDSTPRWWHWRKNYSLWLIPPQNRARKMLSTVLESQIFEGCISIAILLSCFCLAIDNPRLPPDSVERRFLNFSEIFFVAVFSVEMMLRVVCNGFFIGSRPYWSNGWNRIDFVTLSFSVGGIVTKYLLVGVLEGSFFPVFRSLRVLRIIKRSQSLKIMVKSLIRSIPACLNVIFISFLFFLVFGMFATQLFAGLFWYCTDPDATGYDTCLGTWFDPNYNFEEREKLWVNPGGNFDNIIVALGTFFSISTTEGWVDVMYSGMDATAVGEQPKEDNQRYMGLFFVLFMLVGSFFILNLFAGVVIDNFVTVEEEITGTAYLSDTQREWMKLKADLSRSKGKKLRKPPSNRVSTLCYQIVTSPSFDKVLVVVICLNIAVMASEYYRQPAAWTAFIFAANTIMLSIYVLESLAKLIAFGFTLFFIDFWRVFDLAVVLVSIASFFDFGINLSVLRVLRVVRVLRLVRLSKRTRALMNALVNALPAIISAGVLLLILLFIYTVVGIQLFALIDDGSVLTRQANFQHFDTAMLLVFRMITGESWPAIMYACQVQPPYCGEENCGRPYIAPIYFFSYVVLGTYVILNLFVAILYDKFVGTAKEENRVVVTENIEEFNARWSELDPKATQWIPVHHIQQLVVDLSPPLGLGGTYDLRAFLKIAAKMQLNPIAGKVDFQQVLFGLLAAALGTTRGYATDIGTADLLQEIGVSTVHASFWFGMSELGLPGAQNRKLAEFFTQDVSSKSIAPPVADLINQGTTVQVKPLEYRHKATHKHIIQKKAKENDATAGDGYTTDSSDEAADAEEDRKFYEAKRAPSIVATNEKVFDVTIGGDNEGRIEIHPRELSRMPMKITLTTTDQNHSPMRADSVEMDDSDVLVEKDEWQDEPFLKASLGAEKERRDTD